MNAATNVIRVRFANRKRRRGPPPEGHETPVVPLFARREAQKEEQEQLTAQDLYEDGCRAEDAGNLELAEESYRACLELDQNHSSARINLGKVLHDQGLVVEALGNYAAVVGREPTNDTALYNMGTALEDLGRIPEAIARYEQAVVVTPGMADAWHNLARLLQQQGNEVAAMQAAARYRQLLRKGQRP